MKKLIFLILILINLSCNAQKQQTLDFIKNESVGGQLDFSKIVERDYSKAPFIRFGDILYNKKDFGILMWGAKVKSLGIDSLEEVEKLWEEINNRALTEPEKRALKIGFEAKIEN
ncbi:hypothetical protein FLCU109888_13295 [Flavobacterium cucumis]|uniref:Uncharacterized protein n=1 Tax=Flavobacterium cucumis TaxID=416016 RepID=A0A1M7ZYP4_9FLAO|nr:hypothetical protein [Flavobacterium cucumis]SHO73747.1 hypothetical protein SAMN05443547_2119 [Flavobacterium cucumis]